MESGSILAIGDRNYCFRQELDGWDLYLHFIKGDTFNYVIDTGLGSDSIAPIKAYLSCDPKPILVINTHYHWDHVWGNHCFASRSIVAHALCRERMAERWWRDYEKNKGYSKGTVECRLPNLLFDGDLYFADDGIRLFHTPGHTLDSISVYDERDRILNAGDNIGDTMEELVPSLEAEEAVYQNTILTYQGLGIDTCVSGHNVPLKPSVFDDILNLLTTP